MTIGNVAFVSVFADSVLFPVGGETVFSLFFAALRERFPEADCRLVVPARSTPRVEPVAKGLAGVHVATLSGLPLMNDIGRYVRDTGAHVVVLVDLSRPAVDFGRLETLVAAVADGEAAVALGPCVDAVVVSSARWPETEALLAKYLSQSPPTVDALRKMLMLLTGMIPEAGFIRTVAQLPDGVDPQENLAPVLDTFAIGAGPGLARLVRLLFRLRGTWPTFEDLVSEVVVQRVAETWDILSHAGRMDEFHRLEDAHTLASYIESGRRDVEQMILGRQALMKGGDPRAMRILEIGCGNGRLLYALAENFGRAYGVDVMDDHVAEALFLCRGFDNVHATRCNGFDLAAFENNFFDIAFSYGVLQHVPRPEIIAGYIREIGRTLKPGGTYLLHLLGRADDVTPDRPVLGDAGDTRYGWPFSRQELQAMTDDAGLVDTVISEGMVHGDALESIRADRVFSMTGRRP